MRLRRSKKLDCVQHRTCDQVAIYRNAGRPGFDVLKADSLNARKTPDIQVAALAVHDPNGKVHFEIGDGLTPTKQLERCPDAYLLGHAWPEGMEKNSPPYCVRAVAACGLDNYIFAEGYIIRGPNGDDDEADEVPVFDGASGEE